MPVEIRDIAPRDVAEVLRLAEEWRRDVYVRTKMAWDSGSVARLIVRFARNPQAFAFVAVEDGRVVGWIGGSRDVFPWDDRYATGSVFSWYVAQNRRYTKVAQVLYDRFERWCRESECDYAALNFALTDDASERAMRRLLGRKGYRPGLIHGFKKLRGD